MALFGYHHPLTILKDESVGKVEYGGQKQVDVEDVVHSNKGLFILFLYNILSFLSPLSQCMLKLIILYSCHLVLVKCGQGTTDDELSPTCVSSLLGIHIEGVAAGLWHTVCISADGDVYAFGGNQFGQLGTGTDQAEVCYN